MKKVLLIDDELYMRSYLPRMLNRMGVEVYTAAGAAEGIRIFEEKHPDLVFLDIVLGDGHGLQVFHKLKEIDKDVKVCFLSASDGVMSKMETMNLGAVGFLPKPFVIEDVIQVLELI